MADNQSISKIVTSVADFILFLAETIINLLLECLGFFCNFKVFFPLSSLVSIFLGLAFAKSPLWQITIFVSSLVILYTAYVIVLTMIMLFISEGPIMSDSAMIKRQKRRLMNVIPNLKQ